MVQPIPNGIEKAFTEGTLITEIDLEGKITYANRLFLEFSGYHKNDLIGQHASILRHPDMPECCIGAMMETVKKGEPWEGYVKNLCMDGQHFWSIVVVTPKIDENGNLIGMIAARKPPGALTLEEIKVKYAQMMAAEACHNSASEDGFIKEWA